MEQKLFTQNKAILDNIKEMTKVNKDSISNFIGVVPKELEIFLETIEKRDQMLLKYIDYIEKFNFSEEYTVPSVFPGIRTHAENVSIDTLNDVKTEMRETAKDISLLNKQIADLSTSILQNIKKLFSSYVDYNTQENNFFDFAKDILREMDSVYDIGNLGE